MSRLTLPVIAVAALAAIRQPVQGQSAASAIVPAGTTLRLTIVGSPIPAHPADNDKITLLRADSTFLWVSGLSRTKTDTIAYLALYRLEVRDGSDKRSHAIVGGAVAAAAMMSVPFIIVGVAHPTYVRSPSYYQVFGTVLGIAAGVGGVLGSIAPTTRWRTVHPPLVVTPAADSTVAH